MCLVRKGSLHKFTVAPRNEDIFLRKRGQSSFSFYVALRAAWSKFASSCGRVASINVHVCALACPFLDPSHVRWRHIPEHKSTFFCTRVKLKDWQCCCWVKLVHLFNGAAQECVIWRRTCGKHKEDAILQEFYDLKEVQFIRRLWTMTSVLSMLSLKLPESFTAQKAMEEKQTKRGGKWRVTGML